MYINIKIPELTKPHLVDELQKFISKESKKLSVEIAIETHRGSKVKVNFVNTYNYPYDWKTFIKQINFILELDKH